MRSSFTRNSILIAGLIVAGAASRTFASNPHVDFGAFVAAQLSDHAEQLFGFIHPLAHSAAGPYDGPDSRQAIVVAPGLKVSLVSSAVASAADQIALWPNDDHPTHLFVCDEETSTPAVQRVDLCPPGSLECHDHRNRPVLVRPGPADPVGHDHRR